MCLKPTVVFGVGEDTDADLEAHALVRLALRLVDVAPRAEPHRLTPRHQVTIAMERVGTGSRQILTAHIHLKLIAKNIEK